MPVEITPTLIDGEGLDFSEPDPAQAARLTNSQINEKYVRGEVRIVTEQARYPLNTIASMVDSDSYTLSPEYQRRHRWAADRQSKLIESLIMNVPIPPVFLYEYDYSKYEVMDGQQRLTAIHDFYQDKFALSDLTQWTELNGRKYSDLPEKIKEGIDRRYLSSVILLKETAKNSEDALKLKQLVFERLNSGGTKLEPQEMRNAIYDGPLNHLCIRLSKTGPLCRLWDIPEPDQEEINGGLVSDARLQYEAFRRMEDVELVLRFFAYRQKHRLHRGGVPLSRYLDDFLQHGNAFAGPTLQLLEEIFVATITLVEDIFGEKAFWLYRRRGREGRWSWSWLERPTTTVYDPLMLVVSRHLDDAAALRSRAQLLQERLPVFYQENYDSFGGRNVNPSALQDRDRKFEELIASVLAEP